MSNTDPQETVRETEQFVSLANQETPTNDGLEERLSSPTSNKARSVAKTTNVGNMFDESDFQTEHDLSDSVSDWRYRTATKTAVCGYIICQTTLVALLLGLGHGDELRQQICTAVIGFGVVCLAYIFRMNIRALAGRIASALK